LLNYATSSLSISSRNDNEYINECRALGMNSHIPEVFIVEAIEDNLLEAYAGFMI